MDNVRPFHSYSGAGRYICAEYAHRDSEQVYSVLKKLYASGYNIWYDEGRSVSDSLELERRNAIVKCELFLMFISPTSIQPQSTTLRSLERAKALRKPISYVHIDSFEMPDGMETFYQGERMINGDENEVVEQLMQLLPVNARGCDSREPDDFVIQEEGIMSEGSDRPLKTLGMLYSDTSADSLAETTEVAAPESGIDDDETADASRGGSSIGGSNDCEYIVNSDDTLTLVSYSGDSSELIIPAVLEGRFVTKIGDQAFRDCSTLKTIELPGSLKFIGHNAFRGCRRLTQITIPNSVNAVGACAFYACPSLNKLIIPDSVTAIGDFAFRGCSSLSRVTMPDSVAVIGDDAFMDCMLLIIECTANSYSHWYATRNNVPFRLISADMMDNRVKPLRHSESVLNELQLHSDSHIASAAKREISDRAGGAEKPTAAPARGTPKAAEKKPAPAPMPAPQMPVTQQQSQQQPQKNIRSVAAASESTLTRAPESVKSYSPVLKSTADRFAYLCFSDEDYPALKQTIEYLQTNGCNLWRGENPTVSVSAYRAVESAIDRSRLFVLFLSSNAMNSNRVISTELECAVRKGLDSILVISGDDATLPIPLREISDERLIMRSGFSQRDFDRMLTDILSEAGCCREAARDVKNQEELKAMFSTELYDYAVTSGGAAIVKYKGDAEQLEIPAKLCGYGVIEIGSRAFQGNRTLREITLPPSVVLLDVEAFKDCSALSKVNLPTSIAKIGYGCFRDCVALSDISLPSTVSEIGWHAFAGCRSLTAIAIPQNVTRIESWAFDGCVSLTKILMSERVTKIHVNAFFNCSKRLTIVAPKDSYAQKFALHNGYRWKRSSV